MSFPAHLTGRMHLPFLPTVGSFNSFSRMPQDRLKKTENIQFICNKNSKKYFKDKQKTNHLVYKILTPKKDSCFSFPLKLWSHFIEFSFIYLHFTKNDLEVQ